MKTDWQRRVLASSGYLELGMFAEAAQVLCQRRGPLRNADCVDLADLLRAQGDGYRGSEIGLATFHLSHSAVLLSAAS